MNAARILAFAGALILSSQAMAQQNSATPAPPLRTGHLQCGPAQLRAETQYLDLPDQSRQILTQILTLKSTPTGKEKRLAHDAQPMRQPFLKHTPVLDAAVTGWACLEGRSGQPYIYLAYTCIESRARPRCTGIQREWVRLFDTAGRPLNAHAPRRGPRTLALMQKLGLGHYLSEGVSLQDIDE